MAAAKATPTKTGSATGQDIWSQRFERELVFFTRDCWERGACFVDMLGYVTISFQIFSLIIPRWLSPCSGFILASFIPPFCFM